MKLLLIKFWNILKEFFKSDMNRELEKIPTLIAEEKAKYKARLKQMNDRELLEEICYQLRF